MIYLDTWETMCTEERYRDTLSTVHGICYKILWFFFFTKPRSCVVQKIIRDIFINAVPAHVNKQHALNLTKDQQSCCVFTANETPVRRVILVKLVKLFIIVLHVSSLVAFFVLIIFFKLPITLDLRMSLRSDP